ncbi:Exonuclease RNase T and DNA polymerase III [Anaeromyxobacter sp. K]|uniref:3'-5' exonuclease n=1 Tax=Anaeromyxobacter sp. (strain K) TaxID=447217 RepID=UPI00015F9182|nr:3'-5' exonuclease [Anaeromyxobacter sp. K]ACG74963.1 Exonuclease RNase T and DNA polymerase III [Anaeromyxobacter sp. K]
MLFSSPPWESAVYWSLDLETGGLDARRDAILAVGMLPVREGHLRLGEAYRTLVRPEQGKAVSPRSVQAHQLVAGDTRGAPALAEVLPELERRLRDAVLLVHHAPIELGFLKRAFRAAGLRWPGPPVVDTVKLLLRLDARERRRFPELPADPPVLNLSAARRRLGLPDYQAHDALTDAVATAELFLVLREALGARRLRDLT